MHLVRNAVHHWPAVPGLKVPAWEVHLRGALLALLHCTPSGLAQDFSPSAKGRLDGEVTLHRHGEFLWRKGAKRKRHRGSQTEAQIHFDSSHQGLARLAWYSSA